MHLPALPKRHRPLLIGAVLALACLVFASTAAAESRLFWTNNETGSIGSANRAGGEVNESLFSASPEPFGIAADSSHVYWSDEGTGEIGRAELDGGNVEPSLVPNGGEVPEGVAVTANTSTGRTCWGSRSGGRNWTAAKRNSTSSS